jgi:hypothetical protein
MGHNLDLTRMLGAPSVWTCPRCGEVQGTGFDDYDVECGNPNPRPGVWALDLYCYECDLEHTHNAAVKLKENTGGT